MQPLYLEMIGYGPYVDRTEIDFKELPENLTLISGNTGAGKTTIFDAICCALFGESSGRDRSFKQMRSDFIPDNTPTKIHFKFRIKEKDYEIIRYAPYERKKKNSDETTFINAKAELVLPDETVITGVKNVNEKINDILGIGQDEFRQIVMIAQNDFMAMIKEAGKKQERIFNRIFNAKLYENFSRKILEKNKEYKQKVSEEAGRILSALNNTGLEFDQASFNSDEINTVKLEELVKKSEDKYKVEFKENEKTLKKLKDKLRNEEIKKENTKKLLEDFNLRNKAQEELSDLRAKLPEIEKLKSKKDSAVRARDKVEQPYIAYTKALNTLEDLKKTQADKAIEESSKERAYVESTEKLSEFSQERLNELYIDYKKISEQLPQYEELSRLENDLKEKSKAEDNLKKELNSLEENLKHKTKEKESIEIKPEEFFSTEEERLNLKLNSLINDKEALLTFNNNTVLIINTLKEIKNDRTKLQTLKETFENSKEKYDQAFKNYINNQAAFLAEGLKEGEPCPVCGSTIHPELAVLEDTDITKEKLDSLKEILERDENALRAGIDSYNNLKADYSFKLKTLEVNFKSIKDLDIHESEFLTKFLNKLKSTEEILEKEEAFISICSGKDLSNLLKVLLNKANSRINLTREEISNNNKALEFNKKEKQREVRLSQEVQSLEKEKIKLEQSLQDTRETTIKIKTQLKSLQEKCIYRDLNEAQKVLKKKKQIFSDYDRSFKVARANLDKASKELESVRGEIKTIADQIKSSRTETEELKKKFIQSLSEGGFKSQDEFLRLRLEPKKLKELSQTIDNYNNQNLTLQTKLQELNKRLENSATRF